MSELEVQVKLRRLENNQVLDRRLAIAALVIAIVVGGLTFWNVRSQNAQTRKAEARQGWSEFMLRADDEQLWRAKKNLRSFLEQVKRLPDALRERNTDAFLLRTTTKCVSLYVYATTVPITGTTDDCLPKGAKPEDKEKYYADLDMSRRVIKELHEKLMLLDKDGEITEPVLRRFANDSAVEFLANVWLPVEKGLNHVVEKDPDARDKDAQALSDWYAQRVRKLKEVLPGPDTLPQTSYY